MVDGRTGWIPLALALLCAFGCSNATAPTEPTPQAPLASASDTVAARPEVRMDDPGRGGILRRSAPGIRFLRKRARSLITSKEESLAAARAATVI